MELSPHNLREVTGGLLVLGLLLSEEAGEGDDVGVDLFRFVHVVTVGRHCD